MLKSFFGRHGRARTATGFGQDYTYNRELPTSPPTAYYLRRYSSLWDAVRAWRVDKPIKQAASDAWEMVPFRRELATRILKALGERSTQQVQAVTRLDRGDRARAFAALGERRDNYEASESALLGWCQEARSIAGLAKDEPPPSDHPEPRLRVAWEALRWLHPLLSAYADPGRFFREVAPRIDTNGLFDPKKLGPFDHPFISHGRLGSVLHTWGFGALLNPAVRTAFDAAAASPEQLAEILAEAEGREAYLEGPARGRTKGKPKKHRVNNTATKAKVYELANRYDEKGIVVRGVVRRAIQKVAAEEGILPDSVRKRMNRATRK